MRIYISGPMTGIPEFNFPSFFKAEEWIRMFGHEAVNPARRDSEEGFDPKHDTAKSFLFYMQKDLPLVMSCDAVAVLEGWRKSKGASLEVHVAQQCGIPVLDAITLKPIDETVLQEAARIVGADRASDYGPPFKDFSRTAGMWQALFGWDVKPHQVAMAMMCVKLSRMSESPTKRDHWVDAPGYSWCGWECVKEESKTDSRQS